MKTPASKPNEEGKIMDVWFSYHISDAVVAPESSMISGATIEMAHEKESTKKAMLMVSYSLISLNLGIAARMGLEQ